LPEIRSIENALQFDKLIHGTPSRFGDQSMSITIEISAQEIAALKQLTRLNDDAEAIIQAAREFLRLSRLRELKAASGKVEFEDNWQELEDLELHESTLPQ
jgi:hypothetical protein